MTPEQQEQAKRWFINRFIHGAPGRNFALRLHNLIEGQTRGVQSKVRQRNATYDFAFRYDPSTQALQIIPLTEAAAWANGTIWRSGNYYYFKSAYSPGDDAL